MFDNVSLNYKLGYSRTLHKLNKSGSYFTKDNTNNLNFILFSALINDIQNFDTQFEFNFDLEELDDILKVEVNYQRERDNYTLINYTQSNSVNNFGVANNTIDNTDFSNLIIKYKNFEIGYQKDSDNNFNSNRAFIGLDFDLSNLFNFTYSSDNFIKNIRVCTKLRINTDKQSIVNLLVSSTHKNIYDFSGDILFDLSYYLGDYEQDDDDAIRTKTKLIYNRYKSKKYNFKPIELNYLTFKNTSINSLIYWSSGMCISDVYGI